MRVTNIREEKEESIGEEKKIMSSTEIFRRQQIF